MRLLRRQGSALSDALPDGWIAIADDGSGDLLVLAPDDDAIRSWDHETGALRPVTVDWVVNDGLGDGKP